MSQPQTRRHEIIVKKFLIMLGAAASMLLAIAPERACAKPDESEKMLFEQCADFAHKVSENAEKLFALEHDALKITPQQEPQWRKYTQAQEDFDPLGSGIKDKDEPQSGSSQQPLQRMKTGMKKASAVMVDNVKKRVIAFNQLYALFSPQQKAIADQIFGSTQNINQADLAARLSALSALDYKLPDPSTGASAQTLAKWRALTYACMDSETSLLQSMHSASMFKALHDSIEFTPQQESLWHAYVDVIREGDENMRQFFRHRADRIAAGKMSAIDGMNEYVQYTQANAQYFLRIMDSVVALASSFPPSDQKAVFLVLMLANLPDMQTPQ